MSALPQKRTSTERQNEIARMGRLDCSRLSATRQRSTLVQLAGTKAIPRVRWEETWQNTLGNAAAQAAAVDADKLHRLNGMASSMAGGPVREARVGEEARQRSHLRQWRPGGHAASFYSRAASQ